VWYVQTIVNNNMSPKRRFRPTKSEQEEKQILEECISKSTRSSTKWAFKVFFRMEVARVNKNPRIEERSFKIDIDNVQTLERYPGRSLYMIAAGLQRHLGECGNTIRLLNQDEARLVKSDYFVMSCIL
jgi:hypothetical protein